jgi:hypothetical protein
MVRAITQLRRGDLVKAVLRPDELLHPSYDTIPPTKDISKQRLDG